MILITADKLKNAITKANKVRNHVSMIEFRHYEVVTPELNSYKVRFAFEDGKKLASCTCEAGRREQVCYHLAAALSLHCYLARLRSVSEPICEVEAVAAVAAPPTPAAPLASLKQVSALKYVAAQHGLNYETEIMQRFGVTPDFVSKQDASALLDWLNGKGQDGGPKTPSVLAAPEILVKPQPKSLGRINGFEI